MAAALAVDTSHDSDTGQHLSHLAADSRGAPGRPLGQSWTFGACGGAACGAVCAGRAGCLATGARLDASDSPAWRGSAVDSAGCAYSSAYAAASACQNLVINAN